MSEEEYVGSLDIEELFSESILESEEQNVVETMNLFGAEAENLPKEDDAPAELIPNECLETGKGEQEIHAKKKSHYLWPKQRIEDCSGVCGKNIQWHLTTDCKLSISGTGKMDDFDCRQAPWYLYYPYIKQIEISDGITRIGNHAFEGCFVQSLKLPDTLEEIGDSACKGCICLEQIDLPENLKSIENFAFSGCSVMKDVSIPDSVRKLGEHSFSGCYGFRHIQVPGTLQEIGTAAFSYCEYAESVKVEAPVRGIPEEMFACCGSLENVNLPSSIEKIGAYAFANDRRIWGIRIPETCKVDAAAFAHTFIDEKGKHIDAHEFYVQQYEKQTASKPSTQKKSATIEYDER